MIGIEWLDAGILATGAAVIFASVYLLLRWREINEVRIPFLSKRPSLAWAKLGIWLSLLGSVSLVSSVFDPARHHLNLVPAVWAVALIARTAAIFFLFAAIDHMLREKELRDGQLG